MSEKNGMKYQRLLILLTLLSVSLLAGCTKEETSNIKAVYLVGKVQQLSEEELANYPEIVVTKNFDELRDIISVTEASIWIDKSALHLVEDTWLHQNPQKYYPLVVVGYNNEIYAFREKLSGFGIEDPHVDWSEEKVEPGFSVWVLLEETSRSRKSFMSGYDAIPTVEMIMIVIEPYMK
jgi:hypothetical protein